MQPVRIEVWSEKGTVRGTLSPILDRYAVTFRVMHGHGSALPCMTWIVPRVRQALDRAVRRHRDPSGMHMSEIDLPQRIERYGGNIEIVRAAIDKVDTRAGRAYRASWRRTSAWTRAMHGTSRTMGTNVGNWTHEADSVAPTRRRRDPQTHRPRSVGTGRTDRGGPARDD